MFRLVYNLIPGHLRSKVQASVQSPVVDFILFPSFPLITTMAPRSLLTCWTLLVVFAATCQASRLLTALQNEIAHSERPQVIRAELLHRDHPNSPLAPANSTLLSVAERVAAGCQRSDERQRIVAARRRLEEFQTPVELKGGFGGDYVMTISFGTPPQRFTGLVDTGSDLVWVQCVACDGCFNFTQPDPLYDPDASSSDKYYSCNDGTCSDFLSTVGETPNCNSATNNTCRISYNYLDGTQIAGTLTSETLTLTSTTTLTNFTMGCMNNNTGIFGNYDGIVGFGRGKFSLPSQFALHSYLQVFAYCLVPYTSTTTLSSPLFFGASDPTNAQDLVYTPIGQDTHEVTMTGVSVNGVAVSSIPSTAFNASGVVFDSGTTITQLFQEVYDGLQQAVADAVTYPVVQDATYYCFDVSNVTDPVLPNVTFHFKGVDSDEDSVVDLELSSEGGNLYLPLSDVTGALCLAAGLVGDGMIVGAVSQANHYIETDVVNNRLGWKSKDCTSL